MLILYETPAGYALFKCLKEGKTEKVDDVSKYFANPEQAKKFVSLQAFTKFKDTKDALTSTAKLLQGKLPKKLQKFLQKNIISKEIQDNLAISDKKLAKSITEKMGIQCQTTDAIKEMFRGIRFNINELIEGFSEEDFKNMTLGLAHGLSRYKLKFSPEKVDIMIIQAISMLDDLDKELNNYMMRLREWYGWHFPELSKIIQDNLIYSKVVRLIGMRTKTHKTDLSGVLTEEIEEDVKQAAEISMGTEINETDEKYILNLAEQVVELAEYRESLSEYLKNRMNAIAPNLTTMLGELVGARLISHAGSLINLAKQPASTVQILGAEKALFKAIRTKHNTPKYGLIYQASIVSAAPAKIKGKISRTLAAKCALCIRCDALGENEESEIGVQSRDYVEKRIAFLEQNAQGGYVAKPQKKGPSKLQSKQSNGGYNAENDVVVSKKSKRKASESSEVQQVEKKAKKNKKVKAE